MDSIKPSKQTIFYLNNTPMIYEYQEEYQDYPTNFGIDPAKFDVVNDSEDFRQLLDNYQLRHRLESTSLNSPHNNDTYKISSSTDPESGLNVPSPLGKKTVDISSLFDSTQNSQKEHLEHLAESNGNKELFFRIIEKLDEYETKIEHVNDKIVKERYEHNATKIELKNIQNQIYNLNKNNKKINFEIDYLNEEMYNMDVKIIENNQYARRESIIISGIPENIDQRHLEENVLLILRSIGLTSITSFNISACHRLAKKKNDRYPAQTIVRFTNRKITNFCLENRDRLLELRNQLKMNLRFFESLCESNKKVYHECFDLKKNGHIKDYYIRNGFVKIVRNDGNNPIKIRHPDDLYFYFNDY